MNKVFQDGELLVVPEVKKSVPYLQQICDRADLCPQKQSLLPAEAPKREAEFCAWRSIRHIVASIILHMCTCWSLLVHTLLFKACIVPKATILAEAATSQASPPPPVLVKGNGQRERKETTETSLWLQLIVSPWGIYKLHTGGQGWAVGSP